MKSLSKKLNRLEHRLNPDHELPTVYVHDRFAYFTHEKEGIFQDAQEQSAFMAWRARTAAEAYRPDQSPTCVYRFDEDDIRRHLPEFRGLSAHTQSEPALSMIIITIFGPQDHLLKVMEKQGRD